MTDVEAHKGSSSAGQPDLDWSQIQETVRMLHLSVAQLDMAMREGDDSIDTLSNSFTTMIGNVNVIASAARDLTHLDENREREQSIEQNCVQVETQMRAAIVAFQFYDKLSQRLAHVMHSLESLADLVGDRSRLYHPYEWMGLQEKIRSRYSTQEEQDMFDALLGGASIIEALQLCEQKRSERTDDDVELF
jgi:uncharacterized protein with von Willebrand factor type A (vWA) domain